MSKPKFFRDPVHLQIRFNRVDLKSGPKGLKGEDAVSWLVRSLIDTGTFQRLRTVRQNGLANYVFHGMEHSRFAHSMGVSLLARRMFSKISRNMDLDPYAEDLVEVAAASLVHDVGHGPFSHTFEEVLEEIGKPFDHEKMTLRFIGEEGSDVNRVLAQFDKDLPGKLAPYFDKKRREKDHWKFKIVSSQMDADRLDYVHRDSKFAGIVGHGFDLERLLDLIMVHEQSCIAVDRGAIEAVEAYVLTITQLYTAVYYHPVVRAANQMMSKAIKRAVQLHANGDKAVFPEVAGKAHPLVELLEKGEEVSLESYSKLGDHTVWFFLDGWVDHPDQVLSRLSSGVRSRFLFKAIDVPAPSMGYAKMKALEKKAQEIAEKEFPGVDGAAEYFVTLDEPSRVSYKGYDWNTDSGDESVWLTGGGRDEVPLETKGESMIVAALRDRVYLPRVIVPEEIREKVNQLL